MEGKKVYFRFRFYKKRSNDKATTSGLHCSPSWISLVLTSRFSRIVGVIHAVGIEDVVVALFAGTPSAVGIGAGASRL